MPTLKEYHRKLGRLRNLRQMTRTLKMVSVSKLRRAQEAQKNQQLYAQRFEGILARVPGQPEPDSWPLTRSHARTGRRLIVVFTSDRGLCGGFNHNLCRRVLDRISVPAAGEPYVLSFCGSRGYRFFRDRADILKYYPGVTAKPQFADARRIGEELQRAFLAGRYDEVHLAYNVSHGLFSQEPVVEKLLPVDLAVVRGNTGERGDGLWEPAPPELIRILLSRLVNLRVYAAFLSNAVGEHRARMMAMDNASRNADDLIERTTQLRNRARQAGITKELIEIVTGAEASG
jgi:F-type H+-transporting ATPase subunit gamma